MARSGQWMRAAGSPDDPSPSGSHPLVTVGLGSTLTRMWWTLTWHWADRPLIEVDYPPPVVVWGLYFVHTFDPIPDPILQRNESWLWWEAMVWTPYIWPVQHDGADLWETAWVSPPAGQMYRDTSVQRRATATYTVQLVWGTTTPGYPSVIPRISLSAYVLDPV